MRQALDDRLRNEASKRGTTFERLRTKLMLERLLARLFHADDAPWLLKGGMAFELRYHPRARSTRDVDLVMLASDSESSAEPSLLAAIREALQQAARLDLGDYLQFTVGEARKELQGPPGGGASFPVTARLADKEFGRFQVDVGLGDALTGAPEVLVGDDLLGFAGIGPARVRAIGRPQQFAEKLHAYTYPWGERENRRVKDLVDMVLLVERGALDGRELHEAAKATFAARAKQSLPTELAPPPAAWRNEYAALAADAGVLARDVDAAFALLSAHWASVIG
jgi:hypothetical protein